VLSELLQPFKRKESMCKWSSNRNLSLSAKQNTSVFLPLSSQLITLRDKKDMKGQETKAQGFAESRMFRYLSNRKGFLF
jgi:hypothetical protein